ncbi:MAG: FadR family transcriptional regulator [Caldilineaceae bacterium]|nr:FadR family transcriptional regulator [Caldilineaceae bacterium]
MQPLEETNRTVLIERRIREYMAENRLKPGDKLPTEEQLATALHVGRSAVRETFRRLEALGIVETRQGVGRVMREFNFDPILNELSYGLAFLSDDILQIVEIRKALDAYFVEDFINKLTPADLDELGNIVQRMLHKDADIATRSQADYAFHAFLYQRTENALALQLFDITWKVRANAVDQQAAQVELAPGTAQDHLAILDALRQKDVDKARQLLIAHHWNVEQRFRKQIEQATHEQ